LCSKLWKISPRQFDFFCQQNSSTVELVDCATYDCRARCSRTHIVYYTSVDCNPPTPLLQFVLDLLYNLCSSWQDFDWLCLPVACISPVLSVVHHIVSQFSYNNKKRKSYCLVIVFTRIALARVFREITFLKTNVYQLRSPKVPSTNIERQSVQCGFGSVV